MCAHGWSGLFAAAHRVDDVNSMWASFTQAAIPIVVALVKELVAPASTPCWFDARTCVCVRVCVCVCVCVRVCVCVCVCVCV